MTKTVCKTVNYSTKTEKKPKKTTLTLSIMTFSMIGTPDLKHILFRSHVLQDKLIISNSHFMLLALQTTMCFTYFPNSETLISLAERAAFMWTRKASWVRILAPFSFGVWISICDVNTASSPCFSLVYWSSVLTRLPAAKQKTHDQNIDR